MCVVARTWPSSDETGTSIDPRAREYWSDAHIGINIIPIDPPAALLSKTDFYILEMLPAWLGCSERALLCSWWNIKEAMVPPPNVPKPFLFSLVFLFFPCCLGIFCFALFMFGLCFFLIFPRWQNFVFGDHFCVGAMIRKKQSCNNNQGGWKILITTQHLINTHERDMFHPVFSQKGSALEGAA